jgi:MoaA/NifB/PqqE/SkfB family radical SAM enzyme
MPEQAAEVLYLNLTYRCNSRCLFCAADVKYKRNARVISVAELSTNIGEKKYIRIDLSGGEPTIHPDILEIVRLCRAHSNDVAILTHGRRLQDATFAEALVAAGATFFVIPLYGPDPARHDFVSHIRGSFRQTVQGFQNLARFRPSYRFGVELKLLLTKYTAPLNGDIYRLALKQFPNGCSQISICPLIYSRSTLDCKEHFSASFDDLKDDFFALVREINADRIYPLRINEFPPCFFPLEMRPLAHPRLNSDPSDVIHSYADEHSSGLVSLKKAAKHFRSSVFGNQLVQSCRGCRHDNYCIGRPSPYFSASYLQQFGEKEFHPEVSK